MKLAGYFSGGLFQHLGKDWNTIRRDQVRRPRHANRGDNFSLTVQEWHADAANANYTFFIIQGVPKLPHVVDSRSRRGPVTIVLSLCRAKRLTVMSWESRPSPRKAN